MVGRFLGLMLLIVEIGAAVGWVGVVVAWAVRQARTEATIMSPRHLYGVGLPITAAAAVVIHMAADRTTPLRLWWIPLMWLALAGVMWAVRRVQVRPRRTRRAHLR